MSNLSDQQIEFVQMIRTRCWSARTDCGIVEHRAESSNIVRKRQTLRGIVKHCAGESNIARENRTLCGNVEHSAEASNIALDF